MQFILETVCSVKHLNPDDVLQPTRKREITQARQICMTLAYEYQLGSLYTVGKFYGGKDHATVLHAKKTVKNDCDTSRAYRSDYEYLKAKIDNEITDKPVVKAVTPRHECNYDYPAVEISAEALSYQSPKFILK